MLFQVKLSQVNSKGQNSFNATKKVSTGKSEKLDSVASEVASFCKAFSALTLKNKERGYNNSGIRKSQTLTLDINGLEGDDDITISLSFRNFGKFLGSTTRENLRALLLDNINFIQLHGEWIN